MAVLGYVTGMGVGGELGKALGVPPETFFLQLTVGLDAAVEVTVKYYPNQAALHAAEAVLAQYHLVLAQHETLSQTEQERVDQNTVREVVSLNRRYTEVAARLGPHPASPEVLEALRQLSQSWAFRHVTKAALQAEEG